MNAIDNYFLYLADSLMIASHRLQETLGHAPELEIEMALANIGLDQLGQATILYKYVAEDKGNTNEDELALKRDAWDMHNLLITELPNGNFADIIAKNFYYTIFYKILLEKLSSSSDERLNAYAKKSLKEVSYHERYFSQWLIRLGDGTEESHKKMKDAANEYWAFIGEFFVECDFEKELNNDILPYEIEELKILFMQKINHFFAEATLDIPTQKEWYHNGGKSGKHTEHLGFILTEIQFLQRAYPNMEW